MRNFESWLSVRSAVIAVALLASLQNGVSLAQVPRIAFGSKRNFAPNPQSSVAQPSVAAPQAAATPQTVSTPQADQLPELLDRAIEVTSKRYLTANSHSPWQIFHCILAMRQECVLKLGKEKVNAIQWLSTTEPQFDNEPWLLLTPHGAKFHPYTKKYYFEGHPSQFLALLSQSNLPLDYQFHVQGKVVTLSDLLNNTMKEVNTNEEVTWVLWALQHYLKPDASWVNQANEPWSIERLVQIESAAPVVGTPCGGNHRLFALTRARDKYLKNGGQLRGVWMQADQKIKQHIEIAKSLQNSDGSFSSASYKGPMHTNDVNERFNTTGHTMEFLSISLPDQRLNEPWVRNAVWMLSRELIIHRDTQIDCGPLFHTLDALIMYRDRIRPKASTPEAQPVADNKPIEIPSGISLKSKPDPIATPQVPVGVSEPSPLDKTPIEAKPSAPTALQAPMPATESIDGVPTKTVEPQRIANPPKAVEPQARLPRSLSTKPNVVTSVTGIPKIDPSRLANVGQVAPSSVVEKKASDTDRQVRRERAQSLAPALLPDLQATPLSTVEIPEDGFKPPIIVTEPAADKRSIPDEKITLPLELKEQEANEAVVSDEPVSAIEPANVPSPPSID